MVFGDRQMRNSRRFFKDFVDVIDLTGAGLVKTILDYMTDNKFKRCLIRADLSKYLIYCID